MRRESRAIPRRDGRARNARTCLALLAIAFLPCAPTTVGAAPPGEPENGETLEYLDLVVDEALFKEIAERFLVSTDGNADDSAFVGHGMSVMGMSGQEESRLRSLFAAYRKQIANIDREARKTAHESGLEEMLAVLRELKPSGDVQRMRNASPEEQEKLHRQTIENLSDRRWDDVRRVMRKIESCVDRANRRADRRLEQFAFELGEFAENPGQVQPAIMRFIRRELVDASPTPQTDDFTAQIDILKLVREASAPGNELHVLACAPRTLAAASSENIEQSLSTRSRLKQIVQAYEVDLDEWLLARIRAKRQRNLTKSGPLVHASTNPAYRRVQEQRARRWRARFAVSKRAADAVAALLENESGPKTAARWRQRFLQALCPDLMQRRWPHRMVEWLRDRSDCTPEQVQAAAASEVEYRLRWDDLREKAVVSGIRLMERRGFLHAAGREHEIYQRDLIRLHDISRRTLEGFMRLLSERQQADLKREFTGRRGLSPQLDLLGPRLYCVHERGLRTALLNALKPFGPRND